jgi:hypothetical protein
MKMVSGKSSSSKLEDGMSIKTVISLTFLALSFIPLSETYADLYSGGPWRGRVIDADTKQPIEGAVVSIGWERVYESGFGPYTIFQVAKEVLTDKSGLFEVPAYVEKRGKLFWRMRDLRGDPKAELLYSGPEIRIPDFIIYKPSYGNFPHQYELCIYAIGPGPSIVEYHREYKGLYKGRETKYYKKEIKEFQEGLVYYGTRCQPRIKTLEKTLPFEFGSFFIPMRGAKQKVESLEIPLDCPENGEPVPGSMHGFRDDVQNQNPTMKGGYIVIELQKLKTRDERKEAIPRIYGNTEEDNKKNYPILYKFINEEEKYLRSR